MSTTANINSTAISASSAVLASAAPAAKPSSEHLRISLQYGDGVLPPSSSSSTTPSPPPAFHAISISASSDIPLCSKHSSPLLLSFTFTLHPKHRRSDLGAFVSALKALQVEWHYLIGYEVWTETAPATATATTSSSAASTFHLLVWSNPSLSTNLALVSLQRLALSRFPLFISQWFGQREIGDLMQDVMKSAMESAVRKAMGGDSSANVATEASNTCAAQPKPQHTATIEFESTLEKILSDAQAFLIGSNDQEIEAVWNSTFTASSSSTASTSSTASSSSAAASSSISLPGALDADTLAAIAPSFAQPAVAPPLHFNLHTPLIAQLSRGLCTALGLLKKNLVELREIEVQMRPIQQQQQRAKYIKCDMKGLEFPVVYAFLQQKLPSPETSDIDSSTVASSSPPTASSASASSSGDSLSASTASYLTRLSGLRSVVEWISL